MILESEEKWLDVEEFATNVMGAKEAVERAKKDRGAERGQVRGRGQSRGRDFFRGQR